MNKLSIWEILSRISLIFSFLFPVSSYFGWPTKNPFDISLVFFISLLVTGIILFISYKKDYKPTEKKPFFFKQWFRLILVALFIFSSIFLGYSYRKEFSPSLNCPPPKNRVVILLPLNDGIKPAYQDGMRQMYGYAEFLNANNSSYTENFEFVPVDHSMKFDIARQIVEKEINAGTKYFISTMSKVNEDLSKNFDQIVAKCKFSGRRPILICTVTSSPNIQLNPNSVYRFYIRSQEEGRSLAEFGNKKKLSTATFIAVNDPYGKGAVEQFRKNWNGKIAEGLMIDFGTNVEAIIQLIKKHIKPVPEKDRQVVFIAHYGNGIDNIVRALNLAGIKAVLLATSTISIKNWQEPIADILKSYEWYTTVPDYQNAGTTSRDDVIKNFMSYTLARLVQAVNLTTNDQESTFDQNWKKAEVYLDLDIKWENNGDAVIPMKCVDKYYFK